ncbi:hypothetical protein JI56_01560 [SAR11 cluster bacterium PRT-SC02]|nr:hypothetical protein JI56_01560 [SAR11 cluster bacterium PRT-SC02]
MKKLKNWDNQTWLSSKNYIHQFNKFLSKRARFNKNTKILDIGCGRANIISNLQKRQKFKEKPIGLDIIKNKGIKKNIIFKKIDGYNYLKRKNEKYDLILLKQTIHFFSPSKLKALLDIAKKRLEKGGKMLIFSLKTTNNKIPCFKKMKQKLDGSLKRDEKLFKIIKKKLKKTNEYYFNFKVNISKQKYLKMVKSRYISCLLDLNNNEISKGVSELRSKCKNQIKFTDTLKCISYKK